MALAPFVWSGNTGERLTPKQVERRRVEQALMQREASNTSPVASPFAAVNRALMGYISGRERGTLDEAENAGIAGARDRISSVLGGNFGGGASPSVSPATIPQSADAGVIRDGLLSRGIPEHIADGFLMNFQDESGLNPGINEVAPLIPGSRGGFGLSQWTGPRRRALEALASSRGVEPSDINTQLDYLVSELQGPESAAWQKIAATSTPGEAGAAIVNAFLRPAEEHRNRRAQAYLGAGGQMSPVISQQASGPSSMDLAGLMSDPWSAQEYGGVINALMGQASQRENAIFQQQLAQQDPMYAAQLQRAQLENQALMKPAAPKPIEVGGVLLDPVTFQPIFDSRKPETVSPQSPIAKLEADRRSGMISDEQYAQGLEQMARSGVNVTTNVGGEKEWDKKSAELWAKRYDSLIGGASNARDMLGMYDLTEAALDSGVRTGFGASQEQAMRRMLAGLGFEGDAEKLSAGELLNTVQNRMALMMRNPDGGMGMPGAMSDADRAFLRESQIGLDRTPEGNRRMLQAFRAMEQRKIEIARLADDYITRNGMLDQGFNAVVQKYSDENPMFAGMRQQPEPTASPSGWREIGGVKIRVKE